MSFVSRHVANSSISSIDKLLKTIGTGTLDKFIDNVGVEQNYKVTHKNEIKAVSETIAQENLQTIMNKNKNHSSFLGMGYYDVTTPAPIRRHIAENPQWYTAYTPYQAEISQGRLESQYNFQTVVKELTGLPIANASLLDEASAAGEALNLSYAYYKRKRNTFLVADDLHPQTLGVLETRAKTLDLNMEVIDFNPNLSSNTDPNYHFIDLLDLYDPDQLCNMIFQYPNTYGDINVPFRDIEQFKEHNVLTTAITDLLSLTKLITPGELGVNIALGSSQRLGIPLWYGGPHPAFFATSSELLRLMPGRIIGKTTDSLGDECYRLALQTREQHIKRQNATSNICTSQSLLTNVAALYCIYHGPKGLKQISKEVNTKAKYFMGKIYANVDIVNNTFYDTISFRVENPDLLIKYLKKKNILIRKSVSDIVTITFSENTTYEEIDELIKNINHFFKLSSYDEKTGLLKYNYDKYQLPDKLRRTTDYLTADLFNKYHTETQLLRYIMSLSKKDYTLCNGMIPLGSCTMKLNAAYQLEPLLWNKVANVHPYVPNEYAKGYQELIESTGHYLKKITGFNHISFQPNSGATGEYTGLLCIKKWNQMKNILSENSNKRNICLIPNSAHGTNFASASVANLKVKTFDDDYFKDIDKFRELVEKHKKELLCLMVTYPNTNGVFQDNIQEINKIIHDNGGKVYMDGANMNALVGIANPAKMGFDVCHLNLHKTFCIPHGGGGPGMGPILCNDSLAPYLPTNPLQQDPEYTNNLSKLDNLDNLDSNTKLDTSCGVIAASQWSSASLLTIPYLYISAMGSSGLTKATKMALLNANYLKDKLKDDYTIIDINKQDTIAHEFIIDVSEFKKNGITENDIAKRLMDYSFHPPTMSWPRSGVLMFEPTESESIEELDRLITAMKCIRQEIRDIEEEKIDSQNNVLKNAPHTVNMTLNWDFPYSIQEALYPVDNLKTNKFFPSVGRVNDLYGDRLLLNQHK